MFQRLYFVESFVHKVEATGVELVHMAGHYYHVAEELARELVGKGIAKTEAQLAAESQQVEEVASAAAEKVDEYAQTSAQAE